LHRVHAEYQRGNNHDNERSTAHLATANAKAATHTGKATTALPAAILEIGAFLLIIKPHSAFLLAYLPLTMPRHSVYVEQKSAGVIFGFVLEAVTLIGA
jgi:hypothetical protein